MSTVFLVVFYTDYRKENDWRVHGVYHSKDAALEFAKSVSRKFNENDDYGDVTPNTGGQQKVHLDQTCVPLDCDDPEWKEKPEVSGMSWTPNVAVVEVPVID